MFYLCEKSISEQNPVLPIDKFPSLALPMNATVLVFQHLIIQFSLYYQSSGRLRVDKNKRKSQSFGS